MSRRGRRLAWPLALVATWALASYVVVPLIWEEYFHHHAIVTRGPRITRTADEHPGDPINVAFVGTEEDTVHAMTAAGWYPADPITFASSVRIVVDSIFQRPDDDAPVSDLYLFSRKQDMALEKPVGDSPRKRHHVRFWKWDQLENGRPVWFGAATFDHGVGVSYTTGQLTHHIGPDVDAERDRIAADLAAAGWVREDHWVDDFHRSRDGVNGGGDRWRTDGRLAVIVLESNATVVKPR